MSLEPIGRGRNSQVFQLACAGDRRYVAKRYFHHRLDGRDRLAAEFSSVTFLWEHGIRSIPRPIRADAERGVAVYEAIDGRPVSPQDVTADDIDEAVAFLGRLRALRTAPGSRAIGPASEACFSLQDMVEIIERRLRWLSASAQEDAPSQALHAFLVQELVPAFHEITRRCRSACEESRVPFATVLAEEERTLSPSDFGFHNALRREERLVFLDFEYFGWDDPAKTACDVLLHPAMELSEELKRCFVSRFLREFADDRGLAKRAEWMYPLCGLKWCTILLNEFVPQDLLRRGFARGVWEARERVQAEQLAKAMRMLHAITQEHAHFPSPD